MCCPIRCLQVVIVLFALVLFAGGVASIVIGIVLKSNSLIQSLSVQVPNFDKIIMGVFVGIGVGLILFALIGIISGVKKNRCCLFLYEFFIFILFIIFGAVGIGALILRSKIFAIFDDACNGSSTSSNSYVSSIQSSITTADNFLCSTNCVCDADSTRYPAATQLNMHTATGGVDNVMGCPNYSSTFTSDQVDGIIPLLAILETTTQCSGFCTAPTKFLFSTLINVGPPSNSCIQEFKNLITKYSNLIAGIFLAITGVTFISLFASYCLCCHPDRRKDMDTVGGIRKF